MSTTAYNARVKFETGDPYDRGYGPSINVGLEILDGNGEQDLTVPKLKDSGLLNIYKKVDTKDAEYIKSLKVNDEITVQYIDQGKQSYYDFVIPAGWTAPTSPAPVNPVPAIKTQAKPVVPRGPRIYEPMPEAELDARKAYMEQEAGLLGYIFHKINDWAKASDFPISYDAMLSTANGLRISSERTHTKGTILSTAATEDDVQKFKDDMFTNSLDPDDLISSALNSITTFAPVEYDLSQLKKDMTYMSIQRSAFTTKKDCLIVAKTVWNMLTLVKDGMDRDVALSSARDLNAW